MRHVKVIMRVHQMVTALQLTMPVPMQYSYKCEPNGTPAWYERVKTKMKKEGLSV